MTASDWGANSAFDCLPWLADHLLRKRTPAGHVPVLGGFAGLSPANGFQEFAHRQPRAIGGVEIARDRGEAQARGTLWSQFASGQRDSSIRSRTSARGRDDPGHEADSEETVSGERTWRILTLDECRLWLVVNSDSVMWSGSHGRRGGGIAPKSTSESIASIVTGSLRRGDSEACAETSQCVEDAGHRGGRPDRDSLALLATSARTNTKVKKQSQP